MNKNLQRELDSSVEYVLFDYMGDVRKIMTVDARAVPTGRFISDGNAELSFTVFYEVTYVDGEGTLTNIKTSKDCDFSVEVPDTATDVFCTLAVTSTGLRLVGPRKLVLKAITLAELTVSYEEELSVRGDAFDMGTPEVAVAVVNDEYQISGENSEKEYSEIIENLPNTVSEDIDIIATSGEVRVLETYSIDGGIYVRGEIIVTSIIKTESEPPFAIRRTVPFEETVMIEGVSEGMVAKTDAYLSSISTSLSDVESGVEVSVSASLLLSSVARMNKDVKVIRDAYLKERDTSSSYDTYSYKETVALSSVQEPLSVKIPLEAISIDNTANIINVSSRIGVCEAKIEGEKLVLSADMHLSGIACQISEDNNAEYVQIKHTESVALNVNLNCHTTENTEALARVDVYGCECVIEEESLAVKCSANVRYELTEKREIKRLTECNTTGDGEYKPDGSVITVYYPTDDETLFDVAKKFHTTTAKLGTDNAISETVLSSPDSNGTLSGIKRLIIK